MSTICPSRTAREVGSCFLAIPLTRLQFPDQALRSQPILIIRLTHFPGKYEFHSRMLSFERARSALIRSAISGELSDTKESGGAKFDWPSDASVNIVTLRACCENGGSTVIRSRSLFAIPRIIVSIRGRFAF